MVGGSRLFPGAMDKLQWFLVATQTFVFDAMSSYIKLKLNRIVSLPVWNQQVPSKVPLFSFTPQGTVALASCRVDMTFRVCEARSRAFNCLKATLRTLRQQQSSQSCKDDRSVCTL